MDVNAQTIKSPLRATATRYNHISIDASRINVRSLVDPVDPVARSELVGAGQRVLAGWMVGWGGGSIAFSLCARSQGTR